MIKKIILLLLIALLFWAGYLFFFTGKETCTLTLVSGETKEMTARELSDIHKKDSYNWKTYEGAKITGTGKITKIEDILVSTLGAELSALFGSQSAEALYYVSVGNDLCIIVRENQLEGFQTGDEIRFTGTVTGLSMNTEGLLQNVVGIGSGTVYIQGTGEDKCLTKISG